VEDDSDEATGTDGPRGRPQRSACAVPVPGRRGAFGEAPTRLRVTVAKRVPSQAGGGTVHGKSQTKLVVLPAAGVALRKHSVASVLLESCSKRAVWSIRALTPHRLFKHPYRPEALTNLSDVNASLASCHSPMRLRRASPGQRGRPSCSPLHMLSYRLFASTGPMRSPSSRQVTCCYPLSFITFEWPTGRKGVATLALAAFLRWHLPIMGPRSGAAAARSSTKRMCVAHAGSVSSGPRL